MPTVIRVIASLLLIAITFLAVEGWIWANNAPVPPLVGGRVVLCLTIVASVAALVRLWCEKGRSRSA